MGDGHRNDKDRFLAVFKINVIAFFLELIVGIYSGALTMISDSFHLSIHIIAPLIAYFSELNIGNYSPRFIKKYSAGFNIFLFVVLAFGIGFEALERFRQPPEIKVNFLFFAVAFIGLLANIYTAGLLHKSNGGSYSINRKALFWHMVFDALGSLILIFGAFVLVSTGNYKIDPILSILLAILIVVGAIVMSKELLSEKDAHHH